MVKIWNSYLMVWTYILGEQCVSFPNTDKFRVYVTFPWEVRFGKGVELWFFQEEFLSC